MTWALPIPLIVLGTVLVLVGLVALLARVAGGRYLQAIVRGLSKVPGLRRLFQRLSQAALERENPELASALRKLQRYGTPTTPEAAQRALARLTPGERRAYMQAAGQQADLPRRRTGPPVAGSVEQRQAGDAARASSSDSRTVGCPTRAMRRRS